LTLPIDTPRLRLRRFTHEDTTDLVELVSHPSVSVEAPEIGTTPADAGKYIDFQNRLTPFQVGKCFDLAIEYRADGKVIGLLTLVRRPHQQGEIGYALAIRYRGQGYATEAARGLAAYAFDTLGLHRLSANTNSENRPSQRVLLRMGMTQ
jgi:RimJ/RimL family protein N-acetyltransferase